MVVLVEDDGVVDRAVVVPLFVVLVEDSEVVGRDVVVPVCAPAASITSSMAMTSFSTEAA